MTKKKLFSILQYIFFLGLGVFLVWWQLGKMTPQEKTEFLNTLSEVDYKILIPVAILMFLAHLSRAMRWNILMQSLGYKPKVMHSFAAVMTGYLANLAVPRLGEVVRCTILGKTYNYKIEKLIGTVVAERLFDLICYVVIILITFFLQINFIGGFVKQSLGTMFSGKNMPLKLLIYIGGFILLLFFVRFLLNKFAHVDMVSRIRKVWNGLVTGVKTIWQMDRKGAFLAHTVFIWAMYILQVYLGFKALQELQHLGIPVAFSVLTLATLAMIVTPGGLGSFPFFVMEVLLLYGITATTGKAFGWLLWGASTAFAIIVGFISFIMLSWVNLRKLPEQGDT